ncbi:hypothetical protein RHMOL_Rhmol09G0039200 [Rhododendron molle]|uniref:Uncharacterized protein n=1 Tax=Rhododendron molle TaxID=49168 RepID=A0ACC0MAP7_RHOML|nr:hypothetical protein RHMOL_Rhmol09G0039200 [Rhododendron molle]
MNRRENWLRKERPYKDNEHVVGFKEDADKLTYELIKEVKDRYVISIVGTGGLGKTTMARKLYNTLSQAQEFDCYAWLSVSNDYDIQDLLRSIIKSFKRPSTKEELEFLEKMKEEDLEPLLRDYLKGRRYLVVLDDVWDVNAWPSLMRAFPDENNGSRVIMTTRNKVVTKACNERTELRLLRVLDLHDDYHGNYETNEQRLPDEIGNLIHLRSLQSLQLQVWVEDENRIPEVHLHPLSHCQPLLQLRLLCGSIHDIPTDWKFPTDFKLPNLKYLYLYINGVTEDPMPMLEKLPKLTVLVLGFYHGSKLVCAAGGFPQLEILQRILCDVDEFLLEGGAMPMLKGFLQKFSNIRKSLPDRLRSIPAPDPPLDTFEWAS